MSFCTHTHTHTKSHGRPLRVRCGVRCIGSGRRSGGDAVVTCGPRRPFPDSARAQGAAALSSWILVCQRSELSSSGQVFANEGSSRRGLAFIALRWPETVRLRGLHSSPMVRTARRLRPILSSVKCQLLNSMSMPTPSSSPLVCDFDALP